ncbi:urease accessory protein UreD [Pontibacter flavimaris]|uniref:urease accessory protein UreD n=1 Tax=Pontibacter flavimaris TaxID=1797110 RepID=UPI0009398CB2|nr:urease accessory protein UreD [Pontibacter flavimaris]
MINQLKIVAGFREGRSYLKDTFFTRPFRVANVGQYKTDNDLYLMVMSSSPGILDKDAYDISIHLETGARLQLQSQAYQRLYNMQEGATQKMKIVLEPGSAFSYVPHPVVPHTNSKFKSHSIVHLQGDCELLLSEIITCGRKHSGEVFLFTYFQNLTEIYDRQKLVLKDNILLQPQLVPPGTIGQWEGYTHQGTLMYISTGEKKAQAHLAKIQQRLEEEKGISFGLSESANNGFVLRILGIGGEQLFNCFKRVEEVVWASRSIPETNVPSKIESSLIAQQV